MKYKPSILQDDMRKCYLCGFTQNLEVHHVFFGTANRRKSTEHGCVVALCKQCHTGTYGVHNSKEVDYIVKQDCQRAFEEKVGNRDYFMDEFGKNYL